MVAETKILAALNARLTPERCAHTLRVANLAESLAKTVGADPRKARLAGLFHDIGRSVKPSQLLAEAKRYGIAVDSIQEKEPHILHADVGAAIARNEFGVDDSETLQAIARHTLGSPEMSLLDKVLYLADHLEPGRNLPWSKALIARAKSDLDGAVGEVAKRTLEFVRSKNGALHPRTVDTWNRYSKNIR